MYMYIRHSACRCSVLGFILAFLGPSSLIPVVPHPSSLLPLLWPWPWPWPWHPLDWILLRAGTHHYSQFVAWLLNNHFFDLILEPSFFEFWCQLGPNLAPNLGPKSIKNRSKSHPKSIQNRIIFLIAFLIDVWSIVD